MICNSVILQLACSVFSTSDNIYTDILLVNPPGQSHLWKTSYKFISLENTGPEAELGKRAHLSLPMTKK